jgi:hypothetical protein
MTASSQAALMFGVQHYARELVEFDCVWEEMYDPGTQWRPASWIVLDEVNVESIQ